MLRRFRGRDPHSFRRPLHRQIVQIAKLDDAELLRGESPDFHRQARLVSYFGDDAFGFLGQFRMGALTVFIPSGC